MLAAHVVACVDVLGLDQVRRAPGGLVWRCDVDDAAELIPGLQWRESGPEYCSSVSHWGVGADR